LISSGDGRLKEYGGKLKRFTGSNKFLSDDDGFLARVDNFENSVITIAEAAQAPVTGVPPFEPKMSPEELHKPRGGKMKESLALVLHRLLRITRVVSL